MLSAIRFRAVPCVIWYMVALAVEGLSRLCKHNQAGSPVLANAALCLPMLDYAFLCFPKVPYGPLCSTMLCYVLSYSPMLAYACSARDVFAHLLQ